MPRGKKSARKPIEHYEHTGQERLNKPPVGLVKPENNPEGPERYQFDPRLVWADKANHTGFEVPIVSLNKEHGRANSEAMPFRGSRQPSAARPRGSFAARESANLHRGSR